MSPEDVPLTLDQAIQQLSELLASQGWPTSMSFVPEPHTLWLTSEYIAVFRPGAQASSSALAAFRSARDAGLPVEVSAVASALGRSYVSVRIMDELAQGEGMFVSRGTKISCRQPQFKALLVSSRLYWRFLSWSVARRRARTLAALERPPSV